MATTLSKCARGKCWNASLWGLGSVAMACLATDTACSISSFFVLGMPLRMMALSLMSLLRSSNACGAWLSYAVASGMPPSSSLD